MVVALKLGAGFQEPVTPLVDVAGRTKGDPIQIGAIALKIGVVFAC